MLRAAALIAPLLVSASFARGQIADHCDASPTLETLVADMVGQNLSGQADFWDSEQTKVNILLANAGQLAFAGLTQSNAGQSDQEVRDLVLNIEQTFDLPLPEGGPMLPGLRPQNVNLTVVAGILTDLQVMEPWIDVPFSLEFQPDLGLELEAFRALWAQARAYAGDETALSYIAANNLVLPRAIRSAERFRPHYNANAWDSPQLLAEVLGGTVTWLEAENVVWGWIEQGERTRVDTFATDLTRELRALREDFVAGRPDFESLEPFAGYFTAWQRWEDLNARLLIMMGQRERVPPEFFHQTLNLGLGETEPNVAALDASLLYAAWQANGYQNAGGGIEFVEAQRATSDLRHAKNLFAFLKVLDRGADLGAEELRILLDDMANSPNARWLGGPLLMEAFIDLGLRNEAIRAAEVAAANEPGLNAPYAYVTPQIRVGEIDLARSILAVFHREACDRVARRSARTYSWIEWLPLTSAAYWRVPVSRFDGI